MSERERGRKTRQNKQTNKSKQTNNKNRRGGRSTGNDDLE
jgi:hypothetical protein